MKIFLNILLYSIFWFLCSVILLGFWVQSGGEITRMPIYLWVISCLIPYLIVYKFKLVDKFKNFQIKKFLNKKTRSKHSFNFSVDFKKYRSLAVAFILFALIIYVKPLEIFKSDPVSVDSLYEDYDWLLYWKKDSTLFSGSFYGFNNEIFSDSIEIGNAKNGRLNGILIEWDDGEKIETIYKDGIGESSKEYFENGILKKEYGEGYSKSYYTNGVLKKETGEAEGESFRKNYYENGQIKDHRVSGTKGEIYNSWYEDGKERGIYNELLDVINNARVYDDSIKSLNLYYPFNPTIYTNLDYDLIYSPFKKDNNDSIINIVENLGIDKVELLREIFIDLNNKYLPIVYSSRYKDLIKVIKNGNIRNDLWRHFLAEAGDDIPDRFLKPIEDSTFIKHRLELEVLSKEDSLIQIILKDFMVSIYNHINYNYNYVFDFDEKHKYSHLISVGSLIWSHSYLDNYEYAFSFYRMLYPNDNSIFNFLSTFSLRYDHFSKSTYSKMTDDKKLEHLIKMVRRFYKGEFITDNFIDLKKGTEFNGFNLYFRDIENGLNKFLDEIKKVIKIRANNDDFVLFNFILNNDKEYLYRGYPYYSISKLGSFYSAEYASEYELKRIGRRIINRYESLENQAYVRISNKYWSPLESVYFLSRYISVLSEVYNSKNSKVLILMRRLENYFNSIDFSKVSPFDKMKINQLLRNSYFDIGTYKFGNNDWRGASLAWESALRFGSCDGKLDKVWFKYPDVNCSLIYRNLWASRSNNGDKSIACEYLFKASEMDPDEYYQFYINKCIN